MRSLLVIALFGAAVLLLSSTVDARGFRRFRGRGGRGQREQNLPICECDALSQCQESKKAEKAAKKEAKKTLKDSCELDCDSSNPVTSLSKVALKSCKPERRTDRAAVKACIMGKLNPICDAGSGVTELEGGSSFSGGSFKRRGGWMRRMMKRSRGMKALLKAIDQEKHSDLVEHKMCVRACMRENRPERQRKQRCFRQLQCRRANTNTKDQKQQAREECRGPKPTQQEKTQKMVAKCQCAVNAGLTLAEGQTCDNLVQIMQEKVAEMKERFGRGKREAVGDDEEDDNDDDDESELNSDESEGSSEGSESSESGANSEEEDSQESEESEENGEESEESFEEIEESSEENDIGDAFDLLLE